jgi:hypothetical protein
MLKVKNEYLDTKVSCPLTRKEVYVRFVDSDLYEYYNTHGLDFLFEKIVNRDDSSLPIMSEEEFLSTEPIKKSKKNNTNTDDIS